VTPVDPGHVLDGFHIVPNSGSGTEVVETLGAPKIRVYGTPGTLGCDASVAMNSPEGGSVTIGSEAFAAGGGEIKIKHKGWDGLIYHRQSLTRNADGSIQIETDFDTPAVTAVRTIVRDSGGGVVLDDTNPGPDAQIINVSGGVIVSGPCPGGGFPEWQYITVFYNPPIYKNFDWIAFEKIWVFGCPGEHNSNLRSITTYGICDEGAVIDNGLSTLEVSSPDLPSLDLSEPSVQMNGAQISSMGDVLLSSVCGPDDCDNIPPCADPAARRLKSSGLGSSGQDGVEIKWPASVTTSEQFTLGDLHQGSGQATAVCRGVDSTGVERDLGTITFEGDNGRTIIRPDFSAIGATGFTATGFDANGTIVYQEVFPNGGPLFHIICGPNAVPQWGWITMWVWNPWPTSGSYQTHWGVTGCSSVGSGGSNPYTSTERVIITPNNPIIDADPTGVTFAARGISDLEIFNITSADATTPCPADFNNDGFIDFFDYDDFVLAYETGTPNADVNGDGFIDFFDYDDYVLAYETGC
jgi:hypothetical protein